MIDMKATFENFPVGQLQLLRACVIHYEESVEAMRVNFDVYYKTKADWDIINRDCKNLRKRIERQLDKANANYSFKIDFRSKLGE